jgi:predicted CXXCH cytochrome family protein
MDFRGLKSACASCHADVHRAELGSACQSCHTTASFGVSTYAHSRFPEFFAGQHTKVACSGCHIADPLTAPIRSDAPVLRVRYRAATTACISCHRDVHLGQEGSACESCHSVQEAKFAVSDFRHETTRFALTGSHASLSCAQCHKMETGVFPAGLGTAVRFVGVPQECAGCHDDPHLGQLGSGCEACHNASSFRLPAYTHRRESVGSFFVGRHRTASCSACHSPATGAFPAGRGTAVRFQVDRACVSCHTDVHRGSLGPDCARCHVP